MLDILKFANALAAIVIVFHPIIYFLLKKWPNSYVYFVHLAAFGVVPKLDDFDLSFKNMIIGTIFKTIVFWFFGFFVALFYNILTF